MHRVTFPLLLSLQALAATPLRAGLTILGVMVANIALVLVVSISLSGKQLLLERIQAVGSNNISAAHDTGGAANIVAPNDLLTFSDVSAVVRYFGSRIQAATGVMSLIAPTRIANENRDILVIGTDDHYPRIRNLKLLNGRWLFEEDVRQRQKVVMLTQRLADTLFGKPDKAVGGNIRLFGLQFTVIGVFTESVGTFGLTELSEETAIIPFTVLRYFSTSDKVDPLYVQAKNIEDVEPIAIELKRFLAARHRPGARYRVQTLTSILVVAGDIADITALVLLGVSLLTMTVSAIGIANIMLIAVTERTKEIGLRMAVGANRQMLLLQFLAESTLLSVFGCVLGVGVAIAVPLVANSIAGGQIIPISWLSCVVAVAMSMTTGVSAGLAPAIRASRLSPTEALRYE